MEVLRGDSECTSETCPATRVKTTSEAKLKSKSLLRLPFEKTVKLF